LDIAPLETFLRYAFRGIKMVIGQTPMFATIAVLQEAK